MYNIPLSSFRRCRSFFQQHVRPDGSQSSRRFDGGGFAWPEIYAGAIKIMVTYNLRFDLHLLFPFDRPFPPVHRIASSSPSSPWFHSTSQHVFRRSFGYELDAMEASSRRETWPCCVRGSRHYYDHSLWNAQVASVLCGYVGIHPFLSLVLVY